MGGGLEATPRFAGRSVATVRLATRGSSHLSRRSKRRSVPVVARVISQLFVRSRRRRHASPRRSARLQHPICVGPRGVLTTSRGVALRGSKTRRPLLLPGLLLSIQAHFRNRFCVDFASLQISWPTSSICHARGAPKSCAITVIAVSALRDGHCDARPNPQSRAATAPNRRAKAAPQAISPWRAHARPGIRWQSRRFARRLPRT